MRDDADFEFGAGVARFTIYVHGGAGWIAYADLIRLQSKKPVIGVI